MIDVLVFACFAAAVVVAILHRMWPLALIALGLLLLQIDRMDFSL